MRQEKKNKLAAIFMVSIMILVAVTVAGLWLAEHFLT
jgi:hypothetical protein